MTDDSLEQWQQRLAASLDLALQRSAANDPLLYLRLRSLRERLTGSLTPYQAPFSRSDPRKVR